MEVVAWTVALIENRSRREDRMSSYAEVARPAPDCVETMIWTVDERMRFICSEFSETRSLEFGGMLERDVFSKVNLFSDNTAQ